MATLRGHLSVLERTMRLYGSSAYQGEVTRTPHYDGIYDFRFLCLQNLESVVYLYETKHMFLDGSSTNFYLSSSSGPSFVQLLLPFPILFQLFAPALGNLIAVFVLCRQALCIPFGKF